MRTLKRLTLGLFLIAGCRGATPAPDTANQNSSCQPIAAGDCMLPFPSSFYLAADATTKTGSRVNYPATGALPVNQIGKPMDTTRLNQLDGFSPATALLANLKARVDDSRLPTPEDPGAALLPTSPVQLFRYDTGERVPLFAELDHNACIQGMTGDADEPSHCQIADGEEQLLIAHPAVRLRPATRYVAALVGLTDMAGGAIHVAPFDSLKSGGFPPSSRLASLAPRYAEIFALLSAGGVAKESLTLAWDFTTGSDEQLTGGLVSMRDVAFAQWEQQKLGYQLSETKTGNACQSNTDCAEPFSCDPVKHLCGDPHLARELVGTFDVPLFLTDAGPYSFINQDDKHLPAVKGNAPFNLVVHIPRCALTANKPLPVMVFGHGLFGSARGEMRSGYEMQVSDQLCMVQVGTDWIGLSDGDESAVAAKVLADFGNFPQITDHLQQAQINFLVLARLAIRNLKSDPAMTVNGKPILDGSEIYYYGISQGGIEGNVFMALSPDVTRGVLNVGAGEYSLMLMRSADFKDLKTILDFTYPSQRDQQVLLAVSQSFWDFADPITFAPHELRDTLPDPATKLPMPPRHILQQESKNDAQVPNVATRKLVRTMGLKLLNTPVEMVYGVETATGPLDSAYTQWDSHPTPPPSRWNTPPFQGKGDWPMPGGYSAHEAIRRYPKLIDQLGAFLKPQGQVVDTCGGPCSF